METAVDSQEAAIAAFLEEPEDTPELRKLRKRKAKNQRDRYKREKRDAYEVIRELRELEKPCCEFPVKKRVGPLKGRMGPCGSTWKLEIDHVYEGGRDAWPKEHEDVASASRWSLYAEDARAWKRGERKREVRFLCKKHNCRYVPVPLT
jgi:hypothetical protein